MSKKYTLIVDYGKPYEMEFNNKRDLLKELKILKEFYELHKEEYDYFDVLIYKDNEEITEEDLKRIKKGGLKE